MVDYLTNLLTLDSFARVVSFAGFITVASLVVLTITLVLGFAKVTTDPGLLETFNWGFRFGFGFCCGAYGGMKVADHHQSVSQ